MKVYEISYNLYSSDFTEEFEQGWYETSFPFFLPSPENCDEGDTFVIFVPPSSPENEDYTFIRCELRNGDWAIDTPKWTPWGTSLEELCPVLGKMAKEARRDRK